MRRPLHSVCLLALTLCLILSLVTGRARSAPPPPLADAVILIVRHAEKPDSGPGLTPEGRRRAVAYIHYFQPFKIDAKTWVPDRLVATADSKGSQRPRLTLEPLGRALRLTVDNHFRDKDVAGLAAALAARPGGRTILICWHHGEIPELIRALGGDPDTLLPHGRWPPDVYNWVIVLRYDGNGRLVPGLARRVSEHLLPGDAAAGAASARPPRSPPPGAVRAAGPAFA